jgi:uncharacterized membrane protein YhaH (DUF805 family)
MSQVKFIQKKALTVQGYTKPKTFYGATVLLFVVVVLVVVLVATFGCICGITSATALMLALAAFDTLVIAVLLLAFTVVTAVNPAAAVVPTDRKSVV